MVCERFETYFQATRQDHSPPPGRKLHHDVVHAAVPEGGPRGAWLVVVVRVDVDEQTSFLVRLGQHPRHPHGFPPVGALVLPVCVRVVPDGHHAAIGEGALVISTWIRAEKRGGRRTGFAENKSERLNTIGGLLLQ